MKQFLVTLLVATALWQVNATANAAEATWLTSLPKAEAQAKAQNKTILMDFTGSDWCIWCKRFKRDVLDKPAFQKYAAKNLVLVEVDFPAHKPQSKALKKANDALKNKFNIQGFPTLIALNKNGKEIGRQVGYAEGGPKAFIAKLEGFKKKAQ